jgi:tRNA(adenine34) deaminase
MTTKKAAKKAAGKTVHKWSASVTTDSTHPHEGLFKEDAQTIADELFSRKVSPKGPASGMRMLNFYINRAGHNLTEERHKVLEDAKQILSEKIAATRPAKKSVNKSSKT